jgi:hypothetical protein
MVPTSCAPPFSLFPVRWKCQRRQKTQTFARVWERKSAFVSDTRRTGSRGRSFVSGLLNISCQKWKNMYREKSWLKDSFNVHVNVNVNINVHVNDYVSLPQNVKVIYIPPRTPPLMQSANQDVISALKPNYLRHGLLGNYRSDIQTACYLVLLQARPRSLGCSDPC